MSHTCHAIEMLLPLQTQPWQWDLPKNRNTTRLKCCAYHAKGIWIRSKVLRLPRKCKSSSENLAKVLRLPRKRLWTRYETCWNVTKCHACHAKKGFGPRETRHRDVWNLQKGTTFAELTIGATSSEHTLNPQTPRVKREPLLRIRNKKCYDLFFLSFLSLGTFTSFSVAGTWWTVGFWVLKQTEASSDELVLAVRSSYREVFWIRGTAECPRIYEWKRLKGQVFKITG